MLLCHERPPNSVSTPRVAMRTPRATCLLAAHAPPLQHKSAKAGAAGGAPGACGPRAARPARHGRPAARPRRPRPCRCRSRPAAPACSPGCPRAPAPPPRPRLRARRPLSSSGFYSLALVRRLLLRARACTCVASQLGWWALTCTSSARSADNGGCSRDKQLRQARATAPLHAGSSSLPACAHFAKTPHDPPSYINCW